MSDPGFEGFSNAEILEELQRRMDAMEQVPPPATSPASEAEMKSWDARALHEMVRRYGREAVLDLLFPAAPSAQAKPAGEGDTLGVARARELRKGILEALKVKPFDMSLKAVLGEVERLFPGVVAEDKQG